MLALVAVTIISCGALSAVDGDTIKCDGKRMRLMGDGSPFVSGFDSPEIGRAQCERERQLGLKAKKRLEEIIATPGMRIEDSGQVDKTRTRRPLVWVRLPDGRTAGSILIEEGLAVVWTPDYRANWCQ